MRPRREAFPIAPELARRLALPVLLVCTALVHVTALGTFFAQDDVTFLSRARGLDPTPWSLARPLSEGWTWRLLNAVFGLHPLPYHLFNLGLHLASTALVFWIGVRLLRSRAAAFTAALLFGASSIAFTPLHWASGLVELMVTAFSLGAFLLYLVGRERERPALLWLGALLSLAALLSKESAILFPLVILVAHARLERERPARRTWLPQAVATAAYAIGFLATLHHVHYIGSETYSMSRSPAFVALNLATYLQWLVALTVPVRDAVAAMDPLAWRIGLPVGLAIVAILLSQRRAKRHPEEVGLAWFAVMLAPVVALKHHTYLYYVYLPWPGMCWLLAGFGQRLAHRRPAVARAAAVALAAFVIVEAVNVHARESAMVGPFPLDKTVRESRLLKNALAGLDTAHVEPGRRIAFINPAPIRHYAVVDTLSASPNESVSSYVPLEGAMRGGETLRLFFPGLEYLGFRKSLPRDWEDAEVFLYHDDGTVRDIGHGGRALAKLGYFIIKFRDWKRADEMLLRSRALGDTLPDATFGLIITSDYLGRHQDSDRYAREFLARWPNDPRTSALTGSRSPPASGNPGR